MKYSCYYIINLGCFICIYMLFYMVFGTNLLTYSPVPVSVFPCFRISQKRKTKRSPIDLKLDGAYFWTRRRPRSQRVGPEESRATHEGGGRASLPHGQPGDPPDLFSTPTPLIHTQTSRKKPRPEVPPLQAPGATRNQSRPSLAPCRRGPSSAVAM